MHPLIRILFRLGALFLVAFMLVQPFNWFCNLSGKCQPFYFSYYIPKQQGTKPIEVSLEVTNLRNDLDLAADKSPLTTVSGKKNSVIYYAKNLSDHEITFRPRLIVEPESLDKYIIRYQCLCFNDYTLKPGEQKTLEMRFAIDHKIESDAVFKRLGSAKGENKVIKIHYRIIKNG